MATLAVIDLVIIDDIGLLAISPDASEGLYRLIDQAYERRSIVVSSNLHPSAFDQIMDKHLAAALTDRLLHHAHIVITEGESIRLRASADRQHAWRPAGSPVDKLRHEE